MTTLKEKIFLVSIFLVVMPIINNTYAIEDSCPISLYQMRAEAALDALLLEDQDIDEGIYQLILLQESLERGEMLK